MKESEIEFMIRYGKYLLDKEMERENRERIIKINFDNIRKEGE